MGDANSTTNCGQGICNSGGTQVALAPFDPCWNEAKSDAGVPFNWADMPTHCTTGGGATTAKTTIAGSVVWRANARLGPTGAVPTLQPHEYTGGGVLSGTYLHDTNAISYSSDCFFEGEPCVRTTDETYQNDGNALGEVLPSPEEALVIAEMAADVAGIFDPSPTSDAVAAALALKRGDWFGAVLSVGSMVPYLGDAVAKPIKGTRLVSRLRKLRNARKTARLVPPSRATRQLAEAAGATTKQVAARKEVVADFMMRNGKKWDGRNGIRRRLKESEVKSLMNGVDFTKPVRVGPPPPIPTNLTKLHAPNGQPARSPWLADSAEPAGRRGLGNLDEVDGQITMKQETAFEIDARTPYLESTAAPINDNWSVRGFDQPTVGGGQQYYVPGATAPSNPLITKQ